MSKIETQEKNELPRPASESFWSMLFKQFSDILVIMLIISAGVAIGFAEYAAAFTIIVIVILNAALGVYMVCRCVCGCMLVSTHLLFSLHRSSVLLVVFILLFFLFRNFVQGKR